MKKILAGLFILSVMLFLVGCLDYKAYDLTKAEDAGVVKGDLIGVDDSKPNNSEVEGEVVLPSLEENRTAPIEEAVSENLPVLNVKENQLVRLKVSAVDPNKDNLTYTYSKPFNAQGSWKTTYGDAGEYIVTVSASDGNLNTQKKMKVVVQKVNVPPTISGLSDLVVNEGDLVKVDPRVSDLNRDPVTVTLSGPLEKGVWQTTSKDSGIYTIKVTASDGELQAEKSFKLTVRNVNIVPTIANLVDVKAKEGETIKLAPVIKDEDESEGEKVLVTFGAPFDGKGTWTPGYTDRGVYFVNVTADDRRGGVATKQIKVTVDPVNMAPVIKDVSLETS
jgi:hypothetical protein